MPGFWGSLWSRMNTPYGPGDPMGNRIFTGVSAGVMGGMGAGGFLGGSGPGGIIGGGLGGALGGAIGGTFAAATPEIGRGLGALGGGIARGLGWLNRSGSGNVGVRHPMEFLAGGSASGFRWAGQNRGGLVRTGGGVFDRGAYAQAMGIGGPRLHTGGIINPATGLSPTATTSATFKRLGAQPSITGRPDRTVGARHLGMSHGAKMQRIAALGGAGSPSEFLVTEEELAWETKHGKGRAFRHKLTPNAPDVGDFETVTTTTGAGRPELRGYKPKGPTTPWITEAQAGPGGPAVWAGARRSQGPYTGPRARGAGTFTKQGRRWRGAFGVEGRTRVGGAFGGLAGVGAGFLLSGGSPIGAAIGGAAGLVGPGRIVRGGGVGAIAGMGLGAALGGPGGAVLGGALGYAGMTGIGRGLGRAGLWTADVMAHGIAGTASAGARGGLAIAGSRFAGMLGGGILGGMAGGLPGIGVGLFMGGMGLKRMGTLGLTGKLGITGRAGLIGGLLALPGIFKGLAGLARGDDPAPTFLNQQNTAAVYGMDANNLNTQNLTLALHYRR